jgi:hypothetical protein
MADTQPQSAPVVPAGTDVPAIDNSEFARQGADLKWQQGLEQWRKDDANSLGGWADTVVRSTTDPGATAWDWVGRQFDTERRRLNKLHKEKGFDYWTDPNRKQWEAGLTEDELAMLHKVADNGYIDVILALDRVQKGRELQEQVARQNGIVGVSGAIVGGMSDPISMLAGLGVGAGVRAIGATRNFQRASKATEAVLSQPGVRGLAARAVAEGGEQAVGSLLTDAAMNSIGEYRSKDDMEMNAISSFIFGGLLKPVTEGISNLRNRSGGKTRQAVREAADDAVGRMADTAETTVDLRETPTEHARRMVGEVAEDARDAGRSGRRHQIFNDAEQARLREEFEGAPRDIDAKPVKVPTEAEPEVAVTPEQVPEVREVSPDEVDFNQFDTTAWTKPADQPLPVAETLDLPKIDDSHLEVDLVMRAVNAHIGDPDAIERAMTNLAGSLQSDAAKQRAEQFIRIAQEERAAQAVRTEDVLAGRREATMFLNDGEEIRILHDGQVFSDVRGEESHPALKSASTVSYSHREMLEALVRNLDDTVPAEQGTLRGAAEWLLRNGDQNLLDNARTYLDFKGRRGAAFTGGETVVGVADSLHRARDNPGSLDATVQLMGTWSRSTVVHEIVHSMTTRAIRALETAELRGELGRFSPEIRAAWGTMQAYRDALAQFKGTAVGEVPLERTIKGKAQGHHYAAKNMVEFAAQVLSDHKTQLVLSSMKPLGRFHYFANALEHVFSAMRDVLVKLGVPAGKAMERTGFTEAAEAIELLMRANTRDRARVIVEAEQLAKAKSAGRSEAGGPYKEKPLAQHTPGPKDDAHVKYMSGGLLADHVTAAGMAPGVSRAPDFDVNQRRNADALALAERLAPLVPDAHLVLTGRGSSPAVRGAEVLSAGNTHLVGLPKEITSEMAQATVVRATVTAALPDTTGLRPALLRHLDTLDSGAFEAPGLEKARAVFDAAKDALPEGTTFEDVLEESLREVAAGPRQREAAAVQSTTPYLVTGSVARLKRALEQQADDFFSKFQLQAARTSVALGKFSSLVSDGVVMARSDNKVVRMLSAIVAETTTGGVAERQTTAAVRKAMLKSRLTGSDLHGYNTAYSAWKPGGPLQAWDDVFVGDKRREFDRAVTLEILRRRGAAEAGLDYKAGLAQVDPHIARAADHVQSIADRARQEQKFANTLGSGSLGDSSVGYLPQRLDGQKLLAATDTERQLLQDKLADHWRQVYPNWDKAFAKSFAEYYVERAVRRARGAAADMVQAEQSGTSGIREALEEMGNDPTADPTARQQIADSIRGLGHTKGRLDVDLTANLTGDKKVLDFYATNPQQLMQGYIDRVAGDIALTEVGILGKSGRDQLMRVLETSADVTANELAATKRVFAEMAGEATQGFRNKQLASLRMVTGLARLGGLAWNQLAETMNAAHMLGLDATLKGLPALPRMLGEVRRIVRGQKVDNPWLDSFKGIVGEYGTEGHYLHFPTDPPDARLADYAEQSGVVERLLRGGSHLQAKLSFFRAVHGAQHRWVAEQIVRKAAGYLADAAAGKQTANRWLRDMGFTGELLDASKAHIPHAVTFDSNGNVVGFDLTKLGTYELQADFAASVHRGVAQIIQGTFTGERAAWMHSDLGLLLGQFRSFTATGLEKQWARTRYVVGEDTHVAAAYAYMAGLVTVQASLGALLHTARVGLASVGRSDEDRQKYLDQRLSPWELARASLNYSSLSGGAGEIMDLAGLIGGAFFDDTMRELGRYQNQSQTMGRGGGGKDVLQAIPALGYVTDAGKSTYGALDAAAAALDPDREVDKLGSTLRDASRLLPGSTLPPVTILLDQLRRLDELPNE